MHSELRIPHNVSRMESTLPFALKALPHHPPTHREAWHQLWANYDADIASGRFIPFSFPLTFLGPLVVLLYFTSISKTRLFRGWTRFIAWAINFASASSNILHTRARPLAISYGVGLGNAWSIVWFTVILLINDGKKDFTRIERIGGATRTIPTSKHLATTEEQHNGVDALYSGHSHPSRKANGEIVQDATKNPKTPKYYVQYLPIESLMERIDWALDLLTNFRGMTWNWRSIYMPPPPKAIFGCISNFNLKSKKDSKSDRYWPNERDRRRHRFHTQNTTKADCLHRAWRRFIFGYIMMDIVKTLIIHDPYFFGITEWPAPTYFPPSFAYAKILVKSYRLIIAALGLYLVLQTVFSLAPLIFIGLLGEKLIGVRGEPWVYPDEWGSYTALFERGLAGWWGILWHQTFRAGFTAPSSWVIQHLSILNDDQSMSFADRGLYTTAHSRSPKAQVFQLFVAFCLSGFLHASGSYTALGTSNPRDAFLFFLLQPIGILLNIMLLRVLGLKDQHKSKWPSRLIRGSLNVVFIHVWFLLTAPLLFDDFVRTGVYLYEPVPISFLRALGFGVKGDSWWCWGESWFFIYRGKNWWQVGFGI